MKFRIWPAAARFDPAAPAAPIPGWRKRPSFSQLLVMTFSIGIIALSLLSSFAISRLSYHIVRGKLLGQGLQAVETFADQSTLALLYASKENAEKPAQAIMGFPDVSGVAVYTADHQTLFARGEALTDAASWPEMITLQQETNDAWYFAAPVYTHNAATDTEEASPFEINQPKRELLGFVRLVMSKHSLNTMERNILQTNLIASALFAVIFLLFLLGITKRLMRPLRHLAHCMGRASMGQENVRAHLAGPRDIMEMETAFNNMMAVLETREQQLEKTRDSALESARLKGEFAANVSHELRTPLNAVLGMLELLHDMGLSPKQAEYVAIARNAGDALLKLIEDILDFSRIEAGMMKLQPVDFVLYETLDEIVGLLDGQAQRKKLQLNYTIADGIPMMLHGEVSRLRQVLINLLGNALKFTEQGSVTIAVEQEQADQAHALLRFSVTDTGPGIAPAVQPSIFEAFIQADGSSTRHHEGAGLGLAICRQLIQLMGGEIGVKSEPGLGSTFWFRLPFDLPQGIQALSETWQAYITNLRILVITDNDKMRQFLTQILGRWQITHRSVGYGTRALELLRTAAQQGEAYQFAIVDLTLAQTDYQQWLDRVAHDPMLTDVKIILLANADQQINSDCPQIATRLTKPVQVSLLYDCILSSVKTYKKPAAPQPDVAKAPAIYLGSRILVVEDNRASQQVAIGMLERLGCSFDIAATGLEALAQVTQCAYDLVLMDCHMPEMDGFEATRQIRSLPGNIGRLPIIAMTANAQEGDSDLCLAAGMDGYLAKPIKLNALKEKLLTWLQAGNKPASEPEISKLTPHATTALDNQVLKQLRDDIGNSFIKMVQVYLEDVPLQLQLIRQALQASDAVQLRELAHSLKGASRNLGAEKLAALAKRLEDQARQGNIPEVDETMTQLLQYYDLVQQALQRELMLENSTWATGHAAPIILVADDDRAIRFVLHDVLERDNYRIEQASTGIQAVALCERHMPDLILMDVMMPEMDGFTACQKIRACPEGISVPILMITALDDEQSVERAFAVGANDYIPKPIHFAVLRQRVARLLEAGRAERNLNRLAFQDSLTNLANRTQFMGQLSLALKRADREQVQHAILFMDLDRFKIANDTLGHDFGDLLLKTAAGRIQSCVRSGDLVSRFGGDEFTLLLENISSTQVAATIADKICRAIAQPFMLMEREFYLSTSIGITLYPADGKDAGLLIKYADTAMYRAKEQGNTYRFYEPSMEQALSSKLRLENDLRRALQANELFLLYQPQINLSTGQVVGVEALIRWQHPEFGLMSPAVFIPIAEESGLIDAIGEWVLRQACRQAKAWQQAGLGALTMAVNLSARQFEQVNFIGQVARILAETGLPAECLELEITESMVIKDPEKNRHMLSQLKQLGVQISIDDFGTGYSSLSQLKHFAFNKLKIDKSFVDNVMDNDDDAAIVLTIISIAKILKFKLIAEGVETQEQADYLLQSGCDQVQGYYFGRPMPADSVVAMIKPAQ
ncbi:MAG: EAL domain-containing protein [Methylovulum sp.]|nr:EAL domain-containing protein [Methylovulum sp.]